MQPFEYKGKIAHPIKFDTDDGMLFVETEGGFGIENSRKRMVICL